MLSKIFGEYKKTTKGSRNEELPLEHEGLPDSFNPYGLCPRCNKQSSFEIIGHLPATYDSSIINRSNGVNEHGLIDRVTSMVCRNCNQPIIVIEEEYIGEKPKLKNKEGGFIKYVGHFWWPLENVKVNDKYPLNIRKVFSEAIICFYSNCFSASAVMSRRTIEAIAKDKGFSEGNLIDKIKSMKEKGVLQQALADWANEVRLIGNQGAHFDPINKVEEADAKQIIEFIEELIKYIYILPNELEEKRRKR
jgi:hypothetical protein